MVNASISTPASSNDFAKKKRVNRTAKLKQSKLDVRRQQWLSQVKTKDIGLKEEANGVKMSAKETHAVRERERESSLVKLEICVGGEENEGLMGNYSDNESPLSHTSSGNRSVTNFTGSSMSSSGSSSSGSSRGCCSASITDEDDRRDDDDEDDCLDDWEAMADALAADEIEKNCSDPDLESAVQEKEPEAEVVLTTTAGQEGCRARTSFRAWRPDDASRPQCLPKMLKQNSFPMKSGVYHGVGFAPSSCPICCEDLDMTDTSFLPCPCGYRLCLFCHKRIQEDNGRCPGCRKPYDQPDTKNAPLKVARCQSMNPMY
uniref:probable serine/threonine-protein kinase ifkA n=1 Tax=Erigeron canadensis TaxID=72917 RepID=UPI001CB9508B|nr:probable serine/threonine-protein kinase ifkA [Erigeron canadensis]